MKESAVRLELDTSHLLEECDPPGTLKAYFDLLRTENKKINLVSRETITTGLESLAAESLLPFEIIERDSFDSYFDVGSGGGFPSIPVILTKNVQKGLLFERTEKKSLALERILKGLKIDRRCFRVRLDDFGRQTLTVEADLITMRLVKLTPKILKSAFAILRHGGFFVYYAEASEKIDLSGYTHATYCYKLKNDLPDKQFTIFQKI